MKKVKAMDERLMVTALRNKAADVRNVNATTAKEDQTLRDAADLLRVMARLLEGMPTVKEFSASGGWHANGKGVRCSRRLGIRDRTRASGNRVAARNLRCWSDAERRAKGPAACGRSRLSDGLCPGGTTETEMNKADTNELTEYWNRETRYVNDKVDEAFKDAQDHAYALGLKRGKEEVTDLAKRLVAARDAEDQREWVAILDALYKVGAGATATEGHNA